MPDIALSLPMPVPAAEVFRHFVEPELLAAFWLDHADGPTEAGAARTWAFKVPGAVETTRVTAVEPGRRIAWDWSDGLSVELTFEDLGEDLGEDAGEGSVLRVAARGLPAGSEADTAEGFAYVLADLAVLLATGRSPGLVAAKARLIAGG